MQKVTYKVGERVKHPRRPEWGIGEVLADSAGDQVHILFEDAGDKKFSIDFIEFIKVDGDEASSEMLDALVKSFKTPRSGKSQKALPFPEAINIFLSYFPGGFNDKRYISQERDYKVTAHQMFLDKLGRAEFERLITEGNYSEVAKRALQVVHATNLNSLYENIWLNNGIKKTEESQKRFAESLYDFLYGDSSLKERFESYTKMLTDIGASKWPLVSYFPFIAFPDKFMYLKPTITQNAAAVMGVLINYQPEINWLTYDSVQKLAELIKVKLIDQNTENLVPRDMIDVQSFMWVIAQGTYSA